MSDAITHDERRRAWRLTLAITIGATVFTAMQGLTFPLLALILERTGQPEWAIGINAAMMPLGLVLSAPLAPRLMRRRGGFALMTAGLGVSAACMALIGLYQQALIWMPLRLLMGVSLGCVLVVTETWINEVATDAVRGRVIGFYSAILSAGFALGPALLAAVGSRGWIPFAVGASLPVLALVPLIGVRAILPPTAVEEQPVTVRSFLRAAPLLLVCTGAVALADEGAMSFLPLFALAHGYGEQAGNMLLIVMIAGSVMLQYPLGSLADRMRRSTVMIVCAGAAAASAAVFPFTAASPMLFGLSVFIWGGAYYAIYVLALVRLGDAFRGTALVAGNAAFAAMWGIGGLAGSATVGGAMSLVGPVGFPAVFVLTFAAIGTTVALLARGEVRPVEGTPE